MGLGGISMWQLLIILAIVIMVFGTKRLKSLGGDLGGALKSFRKAMDDEPKSDDSSAKQIGDDAKEDADFVENKDKEKQN